LGATQVRRLPIARWAIVICDSSILILAEMDYRKDFKRLLHVKERKLLVG